LRLPRFVVATALVSAFVSLSDGIIAILVTVEQASQRLPPLRCLRRRCLRHSGSGSRERQTEKYGHKMAHDSSSIHMLKEKRCYRTKSTTRAFLSVMPSRQTNVWRDVRLPLGARAKHETSSPRMEMPLHRNAVTPWFAKIRQCHCKDEGWKKVMADQRMQPGQNPMVFDGKRMIYGGFAPILDT
jgi:hypothetical protein